ncbi:hypothetical protein E3Q03_01622 [Wallemia mellicola]|uniref:Uncharacterized protein n=1 Tax=Wallemia mellicola TaxID=1708541 RepID=A0AB74KGA1_9BASI|nr:hypothetical protein E3Q03_01622 [Wallemia mellicola]
MKLYRFISTTAARLRTIKDPKLPGLFYHQQQPRRWAVSLLDKLPENSPSKLICGYLNSDNPESSQLYKSLEQNDEFINFLHKVVEKNFTKDQHVIQDAFFRGEGWIPVMDERSPQTLGRAGDPDDYLGMVLVEEGGKINPSTYESTPTYRLATRDNGFMKLSPALDKALREALKSETS